MTAHFDTLQYAQALRDQAKLPQEQAEGMAMALAQTLQSELATKADLVAMETSLEGKINLLESRLESKINLLETKLESKFTLLSWMLGLVIAGIASLALKAFFPH
jgi:hypothetical protein